MLTIVEAIKEQFFSYFVYFLVLDSNLVNLRYDHLLRIKRGF